MDLPRRASLLATLSAAVSTLPGGVEEPAPTATPRSTPSPTPSAPTPAATPASPTSTAGVPAPEPARIVYEATEPVPDAAPSAATVDRTYPRRSAAEPRPSTGATSPLGTDDAVVHLARRASWGATPGLVDEIAAAGPSAWVDAQLAPLTAVPDAATDSLVASSWPRLGLAVWEVHDAYYPNSTGDLGNDVIQAYVARALWSKRQLLEVMVDLWTNHLVVTAPWGDAWDAVHRFHVDVIRKHALGRYADMLVDAAKHPAMLNQLDNGSSTKRSPNENFGRELLELHTVGVGNYPESAVRQSSLALTGLSTDRESGDYYYRQIRHHVGMVSVLNWSHANTSAYGEKVADSYLAHLARHPLTARTIARKIAVRFVADVPPQSLVDRLADVYLANDTRIAPVVRACLLSVEFSDNVGQKLKRPLENMVSTGRILGVQPGPDTKGWLGDLVWNAKVAGQQPMGWPAPNGFPDVAGAWAGSGTTMAAWNWHMGQGWEAGRTTPRVTYPAFRSLLPTTLPATYGGLVDALSTRLLFAPLPAAKRDAVCAFLDKTATSALKSTDAALGWRLPSLVALVLDSPEFATR